MSVSFYNKINHCRFTLLGIRQKKCRTVYLLYGKNLYDCYMNY